MDSRASIRRVQPHQVERWARQAIGQRLGHPAGNAVIAVTRDPERLDTVVLHVNSGGNALECSRALRAAGYQIEASWDRPDDATLASTYGAKLRVAPSTTASTANPVRDRPVIATGRVLIHRRKPGWVVRLRAVAGEHVYLTRLTADDTRPAGSPRLSPVRRSTVERDYLTYVPCRWALDCLAQRATTVPTTDFGAVDACDEHAAEHRAWRAAPATGPVRHGEPEPECWCPDTSITAGPVDYCPAHGTPLRRGTNIDLTPTPSATAAAGVPDANAWSTT